MEVSELNVDELRALISETVRESVEELIEAFLRERQNRLFRINFY